MKTGLLATAMVLVAAISWGAGNIGRDPAAEKALRQYPEFIRKYCIEQSRFRDRKAVYVDYRAALNCAGPALKSYREYEETRRQAEYQERLVNALEERNRLEREKLWLMQQKLEHGKGTAKQRRP
jgi:hypothetical protein